MNSSAMHRSTAREMLAFLSNLLACIAVFSMLWLLIEYPEAISSLEPIVGLIFICILYLPLAFGVLYILLRALGRRVPARSVFRRYVLESWWLCGVLGGVCLILAYYYSAMFRLLTPFVKGFM